MTAVLPQVYTPPSLDVLDAWLDYVCHWVDATAEQVCNFSGYIKHPSDIPLGYFLEPTSPYVSAHMLNKHEGGMVFQTNAPLPAGAAIDLRVRLNGTELRLHGIVSHCLLIADGHCDVGVKFAEDSEHYAMRMFEQACHIEHYRNLLGHQGRELSPDEAAQEWIERFAACFPR